MSDQPFTDAQREELKTIVNEALIDFFKGYGVIGSNFIINAAKILGALAVIFLAIKTFLGWIGFAYLSNKV
ncbi:hypothetical protein IVB45_02195 [Bradyrhizobium sp. 4]|uniref:hypothetical protein n=1 Tax=Bradyrhizobium sp. 4 TaxID=2782678 RepID=UPI001FFE52BB|nr:hypothetical protein [Bradyrhizobium sp. 4]UPJ35845.1 hypothetical protein IVB45_02195 [Bradyrhizobium sp. 4]